jgi:hypothetical protein
LANNLAFIGKLRKEWGTGRYRLPRPREPAQAGAGNNSAAKRSEILHSIIINIVAAAKNAGAGGRNGFSFDLPGL